MKKRIFTAVDISEESRHRAARYIADLKGEFSGIKAGWERAEKLHLTLKFLGDAEESQLEGLKEIAAGIAGRISKLHLQIAKTGVFPSVRKPRVLWLGVEGETEKLRQINSMLEDECEKIGFPKENKIYKPHLTIARLRGPHKAKELVETHLAKEFEPVGFEVCELVIYESKLQPAGSIYKKVSGLKFKI
jgi:2'-5' RNA ligase